ncbi:hypothetical protein SDRG_14980 [Saprolegnia diclina VS20]|uniref:tRNA(Ile)-lysidine synthetase n=1 Tax=Saprolegnia diclina (strain VS20) TaxID=1156394 RepID=T0RC55_SAPDV|nr:hypothetical protein SDRG_14980 [Saprolegnia diclina VS20]EQC27177.1 hypothetical protein SDRG_14980 [Saprolegnia diclina VS20]|eukprot:XP_008619364.1 hypothetical protein SDRG_14980 [Saprolegnia diclina VS20]
MPAVTPASFAGAVARLGVASGRYAIALSGGADSTSLLCLLSEWAPEPSKQLLAITVDHALRKESADEARYVGTLAAKCHVPHQIHTVRWPIDRALARSQLQVQARVKRYELLHEVCVAEKLDGLFVGHNLGDQAETLLMRLGRGSGWSGLASIPGKALIPIASGSTVPLYRPLLSFEKDDLKDTCHRFNMPWVEDPSNDSDAFDRIRIRKGLRDLKATPGNADVMQRLLAMQEHADEAHADLEQAATMLLQQYATKQPAHVLLSDAFVADPTLFDELAIRVLSRLVRDVGRKQYPPRVASVLALWLQWKRGQMRVNSAVTIGGCLVKKTRAGLLVTVEGHAAP